MILDCRDLSFAESSLGFAGILSEIVSLFFISTLLNAGIYASFRLSRICKACAICAARRALFKSNDKFARMDFACVNSLMR